MRRSIFPMALAAAALVFADGLVTLDDFAGTAGSADFWDTSRHVARQVHSRTAPVPFDLSPAPRRVQVFAAFDSRLADRAIGEFAGRFSTMPAGLILNVR